MSRIEAELDRSETMIRQARVAIWLGRAQAAVRCLESARQAAADAARLCLDRQAVAEFLKNGHDPERAEEVLAAYEQDLTGGSQLLINS